MPAHLLHFKVLVLEDRRRWCVGVLKKNAYIFNFLDFECIWELYYIVSCYMWKIFYCIHIFLSIFPDGPSKEFTLSASTTETLLKDLIPEIEYVVTITSYNEVEESVPVIGQLTSKHTYKVLLSFFIMQTISPTFRFNLLCRVTLYQY